MNTMGHKMNNKLTNVMGYKFANKMHTMGHKMTPLNNSVPQQISNVMIPKEIMVNKKIIDNIPSMNYRKKMKSRLTK